MFYNAGKIIRVLRKQQGLTQAQLAEGIIEQENLSRIECGKLTPSKMHLNMLMERLGYSAETYISDFVSDDESQWLKNKKTICDSIALYNLDVARKLLIELEQNPMAKTRIGQQFLKHAYLCVEQVSERRNVSRKDLILSAIRLTLPSFNMERISSYFLSSQEIVLINQLALYYANSDNISVAIEILHNLSNSLRSHYIDEFEKAKSFVLVLYNLSKYCGQSERFQEAIEACNEGISLCITNSRLRTLPELIFNKAYCLNKIDNTINCHSLVYQAYYGCIVLGNDTDAQTIKKYAHDEMKIDIQ